MDNVRVRLSSGVYTMAASRLWAEAPFVTAACANMTFQQESSFAELKRLRGCFLPHAATSKKMREPILLAGFLHLNPTSKHKVNPNPKQGAKCRCTPGEYLEAPVQKASPAGRATCQPSQQGHRVVRFNFLLMKFSKLWRK